MEHIQLYQRLRASVLSRHFAYNTLFRINLLRTETTIKDVSSRSDYDHLSADDRRRKRWTADTHQGENPWLSLAPFAAALAVEDFLGHSDAQPVLIAIVNTLQQMFKPTGESGYPIRWDPIATEPSLWRRNAGGELMYSTEFPISNQGGDGGSYDYTNHSYDFLAHARRPPDTVLALLRGQSVADEYTSQCDGNAFRRRWEPSQDEMFGIIFTLFIINKFTTLTDVRTTTRRLMMQVAGYLARNGYILVKPTWGLVSRGGGESLVGAEYALGRAFNAVVQDEFRSETDWAGAMQRAGFWSMLEGPIRSWTTVGGLAGLLALIPFTAPVSWVLGPIVLAAVNGIPPGLSSAPNIIAASRDLGLLAKGGKAAALLMHSDCFDPMWEVYRTEHASSIFLYEYDRETRFKIYMELTGLVSADKGVLNFIPFLGLFGLDDSDPLVKQMYLNWFAMRGMSIGGTPRGFSPNFPLFSQAVACILDPSGGHEATLRDALDMARQSFENNHESDLTLSEELDDQQHPVKLTEQALPAIDYMGALALAWLHASRKQAAGTPLVEGFPASPTTFNDWMLPVVPRDVANDAMNGQISLPWRNFQSDTQWTLRAGDVELFPGPTPPLRSQEPPVILPTRPSTSATPVIDKIVIVHESDFEVFTGVTIHYNDTFRITTTGEIAPYWSWGPNDADGSGNPPQDARWPLHAGIAPGIAPYGMLARLNGYFSVGTNFGPRRWIYDQIGDNGNAGRKLYLRINDNQPGGGNGAFEARVRVWGKPRLTFEAIEGASYTWSIFLPIVPPVVQFTLGSEDPTCHTANVTVRVSRDGGRNYVVVEDTLSATSPSSGILDQRTAVGTRRRFFWAGKTVGGPDYFNQNGTYTFKLEARSSEGYYSSATIPVEINWHGQQIDCIRRPAPREPHRILGIGGEMLLATVLNQAINRRWYLTVEQAVAEIERGQRFFVERPVGDRVEVVVAVTPSGRKFLKTTADGDAPNNLLNLPDCPS